MKEFIEKKQTPFEAQLGDGVRLPENFHDSMQPFDRFRVRTVWMLGRLTYEARLWVPALKAGIVPEEALYGSNAPVMLRAIGEISVNATKAIARL